MAITTDPLKSVYDLKLGAFAGMKPNEQRTQGSFEATQSGPMTVVRGQSSPLGMMDLLRTQGWSAADAIGAVTGAAGASLDSTKAKMLPTEVNSRAALEKAQAGLAGSQARYTGVQSDWYGREAGARIGLAGSQAGLNQAQSAATLDPLKTDPTPSEEQVTAVMAGRMGLALPEFRRRYTTRGLESLIGR